MDGWMDACMYICMRLYIYIYIYMYSFICEFIIHEFLRTHTHTGPKGLTRSSLWGLCIYRKATWSLWAGVGIQTGWSGASSARSGRVHIREIREILFQEPSKVWVLVPKASTVAMDPERRRTL